MPTRIKKWSTASETTSPVGITSDKKDLYIASRGTGLDIYKYNKNGTLIRTLNPSATPYGICHDGRNLHIISGNLATWAIITLNKDGKTIRSVDVSSYMSSPAGITFDGKYLWVTEATQQKIHQLTTKIVLIRTIDTSSIALEPRGIIFDGKNLWVVNSTDRVVWIITRKGKVVKNTGTGDTIKDTNPQNGYFDRKYLWWTGGTNDVVEMYHRKDQV